MKKYLCVFFAVMLCLVFAACGTSPSGDKEANQTEKNTSASQQEKTNKNSSASQQEKTSNSADPVNLKVADSHYTITSGGYVKYVVAIENPNENYLAKYAHIKVTGKASDGSIRFSNDKTVAAIPPCSTTYWTDQAGSGDTEKDDTIEISVSVDKNDWNNSDKKPDNLYVFNNTSAKPQKYGGIKTTGEITLTDASVQYDGGKVNKPKIVCVFKDAKGKLVGGFTGYINSDLIEGTPSVFDISCHWDIGEYDKMELYANP